MKNRFLMQHRIALTTIGALMLILATHTSAGLVGVNSIVIKHDFLALPAGSSIPAGTSWLQVAEVNAFTGSGIDVAALSQGATTAHTGEAFGSFADTAINDNDFGSCTTSAICGGMDGIYHSDSTDMTEMLTIMLAAPTELDSLEIFGRADVPWGDRDVYTIDLLDVSGAILQSVNLDARIANNHTDSVILNDTSGGGTQIPVPSTVLLIGFGLAGLGFTRKMKV